MTELLCHTDSYVQEFAATVVAADTATSAVVLDRTAFYPGGGGQPHDRGWLQTSGETLAVTKIALENTNAAPPAHPISRTEAGCWGW